MGKRSPKPYFTGLRTGLLCSFKFYRTAIFADINVAGVDKGTGLCEMVNFYGLNPSCTVAFGDGGNDIPMLRRAGIGVAMGNACENVKDHADFITGTVDDDGIKYALQYLGII